MAFIKKSRPISIVIFLAVIILILVLIWPWPWQTTNSILTKELNKINLGPDYILVEQECHNIELEDLCTKTYVTSKSIGESVTALQNSVKNLGYTEITKTSTDETRQGFEAKNRTAKRTLDFGAFPNSNGKQQPTMIRITAHNNYYDKTTQKYL